MGLFTKLGIGAVLTAGVVSVINVCKDAREKRLLAEEQEKTRKNTALVFDEHFTEKDFEALAIKVAKPIRRLKVSVDRQFVYGKVCTVSGINNWEFRLDFNDFGKVTGNYWLIYCENCNSEIPGKYARQLKQLIVETKRK